MIRPFSEQLRRLITIPGVGRRTAEVIIAEVGVDMRGFATAGHLASWAGMCPGNHESGGKRRSGRARKGNAAPAGIHRHQYQDHPDAGAGAAGQRHRRTLRGHHPA